MSVAHHSGLGPPAAPHILVPTSAVRELGRHVSRLGTGDVSNSVALSSAVVLVSVSALERNVSVEIVATSVTSVVTSVAIPSATSGLWLELVSFSPDEKDVFVLVVFISDECSVVPVSEPVSIEWEVEAS